MVFENPIFFVTKDMYTRKQKLISKVFSAGVTGQKNIRGDNNFPLTRPRPPSNITSLVIFKKKF